MKIDKKLSENDTLKMEKNNQKYVIGVDGGGTKTLAVLADLRGKILKKIKTGSTNSNKIGFENSILELKKLISQIIRGYPEGRIVFCYLGLAGGLERDKEKRKKIEKILKRDFFFPIKVEGDQKIAFRSGTDKKNGILIIGGTGSIAMGWRGKKEAICGGWDWLLGDQGSAFWIGKVALERLLKCLDGREKCSNLFKNFIFQKMKTEKDFYQKFYNQDFVRKVATISKLVESAAKRGDKSAREILIKAGKELAKMGIGSIKQLNFQKEKFPLVLSGSVFKSKIIFLTAKKEIKKVAPKAKFILPQKEPVFGAVKLALEMAKS